MHKQYGGIPVNDESIKKAIDMTRRLSNIISRWAPFTDSSNTSAFSTTPAIDVAMTAISERIDSAYEVIEHCDAYDKLCPVLQRYVIECLYDGREINPSIMDIREEMLKNIQSRSRLPSIFEYVSDDVGINDLLSFASLDEKHFDAIVTHGLKCGISPKFISAHLDQIAGLPVNALELLLDMRREWENNHKYVRFDVKDGVVVFSHDGNIPIAKGNLHDIVDALTVGDLRVKNNIALAILDDGTVGASTYKKWADENDGSSKLVGVLSNEGVNEMIVNARGILRG